MAGLGYGQINKANNSDDLNLPSSWTGGVVPGPANIAQWTSAVVAANTTNLGASLSWAGLSITSPGGLVTINGAVGQTLTLGASGINMGTAAQSLTLNADVILGAAQTWNVNATRTLTFNNVVSGAAGNNVIKSGTGTVLFTAANTYTGTTSVTAGAITVSGTAGALTTSALSLSPNTTFTLSNTAAANNTNRFANSAAISSNSGTVAFTHTAGVADYSETIGALNITAGATSVTTSQAAAGQSSILTFDSLNRTGSATINFSGTGLGSLVDSRNRILFSGTGPTLSNGIIGTWALLNNTGFASYDNTFGVVAATTIDIAARGPGSVVPDNAAANVRISAAGSTGNITLAAPTTTINTLAYVSGTAATISTASGILRTNAIMTGTGGNVLTIGTVPNEGVLSTATVGGELAFINTVNSNAQNINAVIADNTSASSLVKMGSGSGVTILRGTNTYTGPTIVRDGFLRIRDSVLTSTDGPLGNAASAILVGDAGSNAGTQFGNNIALEVQPVGDGDSLTISRDVDFSQANAGQGRLRLRLFSNGTGGVDTSTLNLTGTVTIASTSRGGTEFVVDRVGQTMNFTGNIAGTGQIYLTGLTSTTPGSIDGESVGNFRFSDVARTFTPSGLSLTIGTVIIAGSVPVSGASPIGNGNISFSDGSGGNILSTGGRNSLRNVLLETAGTTFARVLAPGGGSGVTDAEYSTANATLMNGSRFGGLNTTGNVTFSGAITPANVNVAVNGAASGAGGSNPLQFVHNIALIAASGGTTTFTGVISGSTAPVPGSLTAGAIMAANSTRITINQFRNHANLDEDANGTADVGLANALVGTPTTGTVILTNANTYSGGTEVLGGTLLVNNTTGSGTGTGAVSVVNGATLGGTGRIAPTVSNGINVAGILSPGNPAVLSGVGTLNFLPALADATFTGTSIADFQLLTNGTHGYTGVTYDANDMLTAFGGTYLDGGNDRLVFTGGAAATKLDFTLLAINNFNLIFAPGYIPAQHDLFDLLDWTNLSGTGTLNNTPSAIAGLNATQLDLPTLTGGLFWDTSFFATHGVVGIGLAVPEPSRAMLFFLGLFGFLVRRRR